jgi:hypothetical protein
MALSTIIEISPPRDGSRKLPRVRTVKPGRSTSTSTLWRPSSRFLCGEKPSQ